MNSLSFHAPILVLALTVLSIIFTLVRKSRSHVSRVQIDDLLLGEDGKISRAACVLLGSFLLTSWGMVFMWLNEKMTEGYFAAYLAAWVAPAVTKLIKGPIPPSTPIT